MHAALLFVVASLLVPGVSVEDRIDSSPDRAFSAFSKAPERRFDFWIGEWDVNLRRQQKDLSWSDEVSAEATVYSILDGKAILELWDSESIVGFSLQYYDSAESAWVLWQDWHQQNNSSLSRLQGTFRHGRGEFRSVRTDSDGDAVTTIHSFSDITTFSLRRDESFSHDAGKTWRQNWIMEYARSAVDPPSPTRRKRLPTFDDKNLCNDNRFRHFEILVGKWHGEETELDVFPILAGCAVIGFLNDPGGDAFLFMTFDGVEERWETAVLDAEPGSGLVRHTGTSAWYDLVSENGHVLTWTVSGKPKITGGEGDRLILRRDDRRWRFERVRRFPGGYEGFLDN
jgi:hypothetical protein